MLADITVVLWYVLNDYHIHVPCKLHNDINYFKNIMFYSASGKYSSRFMFSKFCYVTVLLKNLLNYFFPQNSPNNTP